MDFLLTEGQWARIAPLLPGRVGTKGGRGQDNRRFVEAGRWRARNGCRWRAPAPAGGNWHTTCYSASHTPARRAGCGPGCGPLGNRTTPCTPRLLDSTTVRAHQHASGARKTGRQP
ncbi:MAG: transposase [Hymenobacter sp.]